MNTELTTLDTLVTSPTEIIRRVAGTKLPLSNGWGLGVVVGCWKIDEKVKLLLAWPSAENPKQLFNEDAPAILPCSEETCDCGRELSIRKSCTVCDRDE